MRTRVARDASHFFVSGAREDGRRPAVVHVAGPGGPLGLVVSDRTDLGDRPRERVDHPARPRVRGPPPSTLG
jgi:hypothetical protein